LNSIVYRNTESDRFITFFYAHLDGARAGWFTSIGTMRPSSCAPTLTRTVTGGGAVLGVFDSRNYESGSAQLAPATA